MSKKTGYSKPKKNKTYNLIECEICGRSFKRITNTHLKYHGLTLAEYQAQFPNSPIDCEGLADSRVNHLRDKTYEEIYGREKGEERREIQRTNAHKQFEDLEQHAMRLRVSEDKSYSSFRRRVLECYGPTCMMCGQQFTEDDLVAHHVDGNNFESELGNHSTDNGCVLCRPCHKKLHSVIRKVLRRNLGLNHVERGVHYLFKGLQQDLGLDLSDVNFRDTPKRVARAFAEIFEGVYETNLQVSEILEAAFPCSYNQMIVVGDITTFSMCPHHLLPVQYSIAVGYIPNGYVLGLSKLVRLADILSRRPVLQEQLTDDIVDSLEKIDVKGAMCVVSGEHFCMKMRGVRDINGKTVTSSIRGNFYRGPVKTEFFQLLDRGGCQGPRM